MKSSAFDNFSEEAQEVLDFARCQRPDGSFYGTSGQCRKGTPTGDQKEPTRRDKARAKRAVFAREAADKMRPASEAAEKKAKDLKQKADRLEKALGAAQKGAGPKATAKLEALQTKVKQAKIEAGRAKAEANLITAQLARLIRQTHQMRP